MVATQRGSTPSGSRKRPPAQMGLFDERETISKLEGYLFRQTTPQPVDRTSSRRNASHVNVKEARDVVIDVELERAEEEEEEDDDDDYDDNSRNSEVDNVPSQLETAQGKLQRTKRQLRDWDHMVRELEEKLAHKENELEDVKEEKGILIREVERLNFEIEEKDRGRQRPELEKRLRKAVEYLKKDLSKSQEKYAAAQIEVRTHKAKVGWMEEKNNDLQKIIEKLEEKNKSYEEQLSNCQNQLMEAREEATSLTEEVAALREELGFVQKNADEEHRYLEQEITNRVKERIRLEVREQTEREVRERTTRQVTAEMKAEKEREINVLREEFKKVFKEHAVLKKKVEDSKSDRAKVEKLEYQIPVLKDEIDRLSSVLDAARENHQKEIADIESRYRTEIQTLKEEAAKEKWEHATEVRKQISKERDREVHEFTQRIEALSKQTDRLLQRAERDKEEYADQVRKRVSQEKQREIHVLMEKLTELRKDSEDLLKEAAKDKEAYAEQVCKQMTEERNREINKYNYRIEVLCGEKENLQKRIDSFEQELSWTWKEHEKNLEKMKSSESALKLSEDELIKLRRKTQNMATLVERYKRDYEEVSAELNSAKDHFREALLESEETIFKLKDKVHYLETELKKAEKDYSNVKEELIISTKSFVDVTKGLEERIDSLQQESDQSSEGSSVNNILSAFELENARLKKRINNLETLKNENKKIWETVEVKSQSNDVDESINCLRAEISKHNKLIRNHEVLLEKYNLRAGKIDQQALQFSTSVLEPKVNNLEDLQMTISELKSENARLNDIIVELTLSLDACKKELVRVSNELDDASTKANAVDAYERDIKVLRDQLHEARAALEYSEHAVESNVSTREDHDDNTFKEEASTVESNETIKLDNEISNLKSMIEQQKLDYDAQKQANDDENTGLYTNTGHVSYEEEDSKMGNSEEDTLRRDLEAHRAARINELELALSEVRRESSEAFGQVAELQAEKSILYDRVKELEHFLHEQKHQSKRQLSSRAASIKEAREKNDRTALMHEKGEQSVKKSTKESNIVELSSGRSNNDELDVLLNQAQEELIAIKEQSKRSREYLEDELRRVSETSQRAQEELEQIRAELERTRAENVNLRSEIERMEDASRKTISRLNKTIHKISDRQEISQKEAQNLEVSQNEARSTQDAMIALEEAITMYEKKNGERVKQLQDITESLATEKEAIRETVNESHRKYEQKISELHEFIDALATEKEAIVSELGSLEKSLNVMSREFEEERSKYETDIRNLRHQLESTNEENLDISKELQHARQLFREALVAWRIETRDLTNQINMLKGADEWLGASSPRDSFSVQSSQQNFPGSTHSRETYESYKSAESESNYRDLQAVDDPNFTENKNRNDSQSQAQTSQFFTNLLQVNTLGEGRMIRLDFIESPPNQPQVSTPTFPSDDKKRRSLRSDEESTDTHTGSAASAQTKIVRWKESEAIDQDVDESRLSREDCGNSHSNTSNEVRPCSRDTDKTEARKLDDESNLQQGIRETVVEHWEKNGIDARDDEVRSVGSDVIGTSSTEDDSLRGSRLLPPGQYSNGPPVESDPSKDLSRLGQPQLQGFEDSRDDTLLSMDSSQLLYTYSSTPNHSREFSESSNGHASTDSNKSGRMNIKGYIPGLPSRVSPSMKDPVAVHHHNDDDDTEVSGISYSSHSLRRQGQVVPLKKQNMSHHFMLRRQRQKQRHQLQQYFSSPGELSSSSGANSQQQEKLDRELTSSSSGGSYPSARATSIDGSLYGDIPVVTSKSGPSFDEEVTEEGQEVYLLDDESPFDELKDKVDDDDDVTVTSSGSKRILQRSQYHHHHHHRRRQGQQQVKEEEEEEEGRYDDDNSSLSFTNDGSRRVVNSEHGASTPSSSSYSTS